MQQNPLVGAFEGILGVRSGRKAFEWSENHIMEASRHAKGYVYSRTFEGMRGEFMMLPRLFCPYARIIKEMCGNLGMRVLETVFRGN